MYNQEKKELERRGKVFNGQNRSSISWLKGPIRMKSPNSLHKDGGSV